MATSNLILITAAVFAGTALSVQHYLESSPTVYAEPTLAEHCIGADYGPALLPLVELPTQAVQKRVTKTKRKVHTTETRVTKSTRKPSAAKCESAASITLREREAAEATIGM